MHKGHSQNEMFANMKNGIFEDFLNNMIKYSMHQLGVKNISYRDRKKIRQNIIIVILDGFFPPFFGTSQFFDYEYIFLLE